MEKILLIAFLSGLVGCSKSSSSSIDREYRGITIDYASGEPISGAEVWLKRSANSGMSIFRYCGYLPPEEDIAYSNTLSNSIGLFSFVEPNDARIFYWYKASKTGFVQVLPNNQLFAKFFPNVSGLDTVYLDKISLLKLSLFNQGSVGNTDSIDLDIAHATRPDSFGVSAGRSVCRKIPATNQPQIILDSFSYKQFPVARISWKRIRNNDTISSGNISPLVLEHDTSFVQINY